MHAQHRHTCVDGVNVPLGHELGHGTAAAGIGFPQLRHLPEHIFLVQQAAQLTHHLGAGVRGAGFAAGAGVLAQSHAVVDESGVALVVYIGKVGVVGGGHIGADAEGVGKAVPQQHTLRIAQLSHELIKGGGQHTGHTFGADLLLIRKDTHGGALGGFRVKQASQLRIGAHPVIVTVAGDKAAVKADITGVSGGDSLQLSGDKVLLHHAVLLMQQGHDRQLEPQLLVRILHRL